MIEWTLIIALSAYCLYLTIKIRRLRIKMEMRDRYHGIGVISGKSGVESPPGTTA